MQKDKILARQQKNFATICKAAKPDPLEKDIEKAVCDHAKQLGCLCYKFTSPARRSVPDRLFILPDGKGVFFIEFKRKGQKPTAGQEVEIAKIREKGVNVFITDDKEKGKSLIRELIREGTSCCGYCHTIPCKCFS